MTADRAALLRRNLDRVRERIAAAAARAGRRADDVRLVAITKYVPPPVIDALVECGATDCGENRVIEGLDRAAEVRGRVRWHFVGHVQTNKARKLVERFEVIHSIDRWDLAQELDRQLARRGSTIEGFVQANVSGEASKGGVPPDACAALVERVRLECPRIRLLGLMTMPPATDDPEASRPHFRALRALAAASNLQGLSMGMTGDFEVAVEEGATHVRVGSALFEGLG